MKKVLLIALLAMMLIGMLSITACKPKPEEQPTEEIMPEEEVMDEAQGAVEEGAEAADEATEEAVPATE
jgi:hypothetical protein